MITSWAASAAMSWASLSAPTGRPIAGPSPPTFDVVKNSGSISAKSFSSSMRSISTDPTMPRQPTNPTRIGAFLLVASPAASGRSATRSFIGIRHLDQLERRVKPRHRVGVHVRAVAERVRAASTLDRKPEFAIKVQCRQVVRVYGELEPLIVEPAVGKLDGGPQQRSPHATPLPVVAHRHAHVAHMPASR